MRTPMRLAVLGAAVLALAACEPQPDKPAADQAAPETAADAAAPAGDADIPTGRLGDAVVPSHYRLDLTIVPSEPEFSGQVAIDVTFNEARERIYLHGRDLDVTEIYLTEADGDRVDARYSQVDETGVAAVDLADTVEPGEATLHVTYTAPFNQSLEGLYHVAEGGEDYAITQFEATSARLAFPGFDEPAFKQPFDISVTARADHAVITTTPEVSAEPLDDGLVKRTFATTEPLPTYLLAFAVGPWDVVEWQPLPTTEIRDRTVPLRGVAAKGKGEQLTYALDNTAGIVEALEDYFGRPYPYKKLDIIAVPDFAAGAMENVGAITYREQLLLLGDGTNVSTQRKQSYARVHAHELAHQWFGNLVTPVWWDDIWLNEAFATWMGNKAVHAWAPDQGYGNITLRGMLRVMNVDSLQSARQIRNPIDSNHDIASAFDGITYSKGGGVLEMFESFLGEAAFRDGVRLHMERFAHDVADVNDFMASLAEGADRPDVVEAFESFLYQKGVPLVTASANCTDGSATVSLSQRRYLPMGSDAEADQQWQIPVCVAYGGDGERGKACALLDAEQASPITIDGQCPAWIMPNANGSGYYRWTLDDAGWRALIDHFDALNTRERLSLGDSLAAGFNADAVAVATLVDAARIQAKAEAREVVMSPVGDLASLHAMVDDDATEEAIEALVRELYAPKLDEIGLSPSESEGVEVSLMRAPLVSTLARLGQHDDLRDTLVDMAETYVGDEGEPLDPTAIDPSLIGVALAVAVDEGDDAFAETLKAKALASRDASFRQRALVALARSEDDDMAEAMRTLALTDAVRDNEATAILFTLMGVDEHTDDMWDWIREEANFDGVLARIPTWNKGGIARVGSVFCSADKAAEVKAFFEGRIETLEGGPRALAQTLEGIDLCAAAKAAKADEVKAYFEGD
ncbi:hypothetical protein CCR80_13100 [Rhodothalassium salexigens]|nr:hypothetical protein [Rhodothalassium salexigens]